MDKLLARVIMREKAHKKTNNGFDKKGRELQIQQILRQLSIRNNFMPKTWKMDKMDKFLGKYKFPQLTQQKEKRKPEWVYSHSENSISS